MLTVSAKRRTKVHAVRIPQNNDRIDSTAHKACVSVPSGRYLASSYSLLASSHDRLASCLPPKSQLYLTYGAPFGTVASLAEQLKVALRIAATLSQRNNVVIL